MGFPLKIEEEVASLCTCHSELNLGGYRCSQCKAKVCKLPQTCPSCNLTLILSTHLARSYHHLFPLRNWRAVSWKRARDVGSLQCCGCLMKFPLQPCYDDDVAEDEQGLEEQRSVSPEERRASESSRYECQACGSHFCIDCDVFCHEIVHNCPGCLGGAAGDDELNSGDKPRVQNEDASRLTSICDSSR